MESPSVRILLTGSRVWDDAATVEAALWDSWHDAAELYGAAVQLVVVHGDCPRGADAMARRWCERAGVAQERHPADWGRGPGAGPARNRAMVARGAALCLAFVRGGSRGATGTVQLASRAGIPVRRWTR